MDLSNLKLYQSAGSPNSRRVRIFLAEKGLKLTLVPVDLGKGEQRSEKYRLINPREMVPTLVLDDGTAIGEVCRKGGSARRHSTRGGRSMPDCCRRR